MRTQLRQLRVTLHRLSLSDVPRSSAALGVLYLVYSICACVYGDSQGENLVRKRTRNDQLFSSGFLHVNDHDIGHLSANSLEVKQIWKNAWQSRAERVQPRSTSSAMLCVGADPARTASRRSPLSAVSYLAEEP